MAAPQFVTTGTPVAGSSAAASVPPPPGTQPGRVVIVTMYLDGPALPADPTPAAGFALAEGCPVQIAAGSGSHSLYKWWKRCTGADADPWEFAWAESRYREIETSLWDSVAASGNPWESPPDTAVSLTSSPTTPPVEVTTQGPDRTLIWSGTSWGGGTWTAPDGFTKRHQSTFGLVTEASMALAAPGASGSVVGTSTASDKTTAWLGALIGTTEGGATSGAAGPIGSDAGLAPGAESTTKPRAGVDESMSLQPGSDW